MKHFLSAIWGGIKGFFTEVYDFVKTPHTDNNGAWDFKLVLGTGLIVFACIYIGQIKVGDINGFIAIAAFGAFLHGWAASPWGGSSGTMPPQIFTPGVQAGPQTFTPPSSVVINQPVATPVVKVSATTEASNGIGER